MQSYEKITKNTKKFRIFQKIVNQFIKIVYIWHVQNQITIA